MRVSKPSIKELPRVEDRASFVYMERCSISIHDGAIIAYRERGRMIIPSCSIAVLIIGPGVSMTTDVVRLLSQGCTPIVWMSSDETRFYAYGRSLSSSSKWLIRQANLVSHERDRLSAARMMYNWRFDDDVSSMSMRELRAIEGRRMRSLYQTLAKDNNIEWHGRHAELEKQEETDTVNYALTIGNQILYAIHLSIVLAIGCAPGLGIVHNGRDNAFIYDISDIYKARTSIPIAFQVASDKNIPYESIDHEMRIRMRQAIIENNILHDSIQKILLLLNADNDDNSSIYTRAVWVDEGLWESRGIVPSSRNYGEEL